MFLDVRETRRSTRYCKRIAGQRAGLIDGPIGRHVTHQVLPAAVHGSWGASGDDFAETRQIRRHPVALLCASPGHPEPGHHLVEDQHGAVLVAQPPEPFEKPRVGDDDPHVAGDGLDDHGGDVS